MKLVKSKRRSQIENLAIYVNGEKTGKEIADRFNIDIREIGLLAIIPKKETK